MKSFRSTLLFLAIVVGVIGYAIYDYRQQAVTKVNTERSKKLFPQIEISQVNRVVVQGPQAFTVERQEGRWFFSAPIKDLADQLQFESFLSRILYSEVIRIPENEITAGETYGLDQPLATIFLSTAAGEREVKISTQRTFNEGYYLRSTDDHLMVGSSDWTSIVNTLSSQLRNKELYLISPDVQELTFQERGKGFTLKKLESGWQALEDPESKLSERAITDYISQITQLRADDILDGVGVPNRPANLTLSLTDKDGKKWQAQVWKDREEFHKLVVNQIEPVYQVQSAKTSFLDRKLSELRDKPAETGKDKQ